MLIVLTAFHTLHILLAEFNKFPELLRTSDIFPGLSSPGKWHNKIPGFPGPERTLLPVHENWYHGADKYLKLSQIHIQGTIKTERSCDGGHNLTNQSVQVGVSWPLNVQVATTDVIDGLIVHHKGAVRVFQGGVSGQNGVVRLHNSSCNLWCWVD